MLSRFICVLQSLLMAFLLLFIATSITAEGILSIHIEGISGDILKNVQNRLAVWQTRNPITNTAQVQQFYQQAPEEIKQALAPYGYFKPHIRSKLIREQGTWHTYFQIDLGRPVLIQQVNLKILGEGANDPTFKNFQNNFPVQSGNIFSVPTYNQAKQQLFNLAAEFGYLTATMPVSNVQINLHNYSAMVTLQFDTGPQYYFGNVEFAPNPFSEAFLRRFLPFKSGQTYSASKIRQLQQDLTNSGYFQQVTVTPEQATEKNLNVPIGVNLIPTKSQQYLVGLGYGTDTGVRGTLGLNFRRLTADGQRFSANLLASQVLNTLQADYTIPGRNPVTQQYVLSATVAQENQVNGSGTLQKLSAAYVTVIKGWQQRLSLSLQREQYTITNFPGQTALLLVPAINWSRTVSDDPLRPSHGYHIDATLLGASQALIANTNFFQAQINAKVIQKLTTNNRVVLRGSIGYTAIKDIGKLPLSFQLFSGGAQTVRGYGFNSLGPGKDLVVGSVELQHRVHGNWFATTFFDAGKVSNSFLGKFYRSAGVGVLWQSPVGALELSLAKTLDLPGQPMAIEFSMGSEL